MTVNGAYMLSLYGGTGDAVSPLLATLFGQGTGRVQSGLSPTQALRNAEAHRDRDVALVAKQPDVRRVTEAFSKAVANAESPAALLRDPAALEVILTANGLGDQIGRNALARNALMSDVTKPDALANRLTDTRWSKAAKLYDFARSGLTVIRKPGVVESLVNGYAEVKWRGSLDRTTPGLSNALTFRARASSIGSAYDILGDPVLREVVTTALKVPKQIAFQPLTAQVNAITTRLDLAKLKDANFVDKFTQRYLQAASEAANTDTASDLASLAVRSFGLTA